MNIPENINPEIRYWIGRYRNPQLFAFLKGLTGEVDIINPYAGKMFQNSLKRVNWRLGFFKAFQKGRELKIKYNFFEQLKLF